MSLSIENNIESLSDEEYMRLKNEVQIKLMIDLGIDSNDNKSAEEWIDANSERLNSIFTKEIALKYQSNPTEIILMIKNNLYH